MDEVILKLQGSDSPSKRECLKKFNKTHQTCSSFDAVPNDKIERKTVYFSLFVVFSSQKRFNYDL